MSPSATPAHKEPRRQTRTKRATKASQSEGHCRQVPRLPHRMHVDVSKRQAEMNVDASDCQSLQNKEPARRQTGTKRATRASL